MPYFPVITSVFPRMKNCTPKFTSKVKRDNVLCEKFSLSIVYFEIKPLLPSANSEKTIATRAVVCLPHREHAALKTEVDGRKEAGRWEGCGVATHVSSSVPTQWKTHYRGMGIDRWDVNGTVFVFNYPFLCGPRCILRAKH